MEKVRIDKFDKEFKKREFKQKVKDKCRDFECWFSNNPALATMVVSGVIAGTGVALKGGIQITKKLIDNNSYKTQMKMDAMRMYDRSQGHFWYFKRKLTNNDWIQINQRRSNGETYEEIFRSMNVLK